MTLPALRFVAASAAGMASTAGLGYSLYLTAIGASARQALNERAPALHADRYSTRFRILIPAHNEEQLIKDTIAAIHQLDYPSERFELHIVADNCTDRTAEIARSLEATVHERFDLDAPGKGPALCWLLDQLPPGDEHDVIVFLDADSLVEPSFLTQLSARFASGARAVQAHYAVRDERAGGEVSFRSAAFAVRHLVRPAGRVRLGGSSSLYGNGMAFIEPLARSYSWSPHLTEDLDMGLRLLLGGETIVFEPDAVVRGEMPNTVEAADSQHERWEAGRRDVARTYTPQLLAAFRRGDHGRRWAYVDAAIDITMPPFGTLVAATAATTVAAGALGRGRGRLASTGGGALAVVLFGAHVLESLRLAEAPPEVFASLLRAPKNIAWKIGLLRRTRGGEHTDWVRTTRNPEVRP